MPGLHNSFLVEGYRILILRVKEKYLNRKLRGNWTRWAFWYKKGQKRWKKFLWIKDPDLGYSNYKGILQNVEPCSNNLREVSHVWSVSEQGVAEFHISAKNKLYRNNSWKQMWENTDIHCKAFNHIGYN